uniref:Aldehyde dehydrogenase domain-containing protein n=1 Tax=Electrophorus electricus TaxID=8005 RepID=A0AAY5F2F0_ELEEL
MEKQAVDGARRAFNSGRSRPLQYRKQQLSALLRLIRERQAEIVSALKRDISRSEFDTPIFELIGIENDIKLAERNLADWMAPQPVKKTLLTITDDVYIKAEPLGVVLIIGAWNYPWSLTLRPLVGAIAAGNAAVVKPSEVSKSSASLLKELLPQYLDTEFYGEDPKTSPDYGRIINQHHFDRLLALIEGCTVAVGGESDKSQCYITPTILKDVLPHARIMQEEIFGPVLPIVTAGDVNEVIRFINERPKPLALYVFSSNKKVLRMLNETTSGGVLVNDVMVHYTINALPFGGVGNSGVGRYHGKHTFDQLSHHRACLIKSLAMERLNMARYPPMTPSRLRTSMFFLRSRSGSCDQALRAWAVVSSLLALALLISLLVVLLRVSAHAGLGSVLL